MYAIPKKMNDGPHSTPLGLAEKREADLHAITQFESLIGGESLVVFSNTCDAFSVDSDNLSVNRQREFLQIEDHLDWLLRQDLPIVLQWRRAGRIEEAKRFSNKVAGIWQTLGVCLGRYALNDAVAAHDAESAEALLPLTIAVALRCYVNELRWRALAATGSELPLRALHKLYAIAEARGIATQRVHPYEADVDFSITAKAKYLQLLLLHDLSERELTPIQRLIAQYWLADWCEVVELDKTRRADLHTLMVDLSGIEGMGRIAEKDVATARYVNIRPITRSIDEADGHLANGEIDMVANPELAEASSSDFAVTIGWLERLYHERSAAVQTQRERRVAETDKLVRVVAGWNHIRQFMEAAPWDRRTGRGTFLPMYPTFEVPVEVGSNVVPISQAAADLPSAAQRRDQAGFPQWRLCDRSAFGVGLSTGDAEAAAYAVGTLILFAIENDEKWRIGRIVRKFKTLNEDETRFGIDVLGTNALPVKLIQRQRNDGLGKPAATMLGTISGILLCGRTANRGHDQLFLAQSSTLHSQRFELKTESARLPINIGIPLYSAGGWVIVGFEAEEAIPIAPGM